jgi:hypothetical protein
VEQSEFDFEMPPLLQIFAGALGSEVNQPFDLSQLPLKLKEIERKYRLTNEPKEVDQAITKFFGRFSRLVEERKVLIKKLLVFVGVDQYFVITKGEKKFVFRFRFSSIRSAELGVKFQIKQGSNLVRGEINLAVKPEQAEKVRAFLAVLCELGDAYKFFTVESDGNIWILQELDGETVEVVAYRAWSSSPKKIGGFVEIEPLNAKSAEAAIAIIDKYEKALDLSGLVCPESIAEIFSK